MTMFGRGLVSGLTTGGLIVGLALPLHADQRGTPVPAAQAPAAAASTDPLDRLNAAVDALTKKVWPSVVQIQVTSYGAREDGPR